MKYAPSNCDRCTKDLTNGTSFTMSYFNTDHICMDCKKREESHPKYHEARDKEIQEVRKGNTNYEGIGCPIELYIKINENS